MGKEKVIIMQRALRGLYHGRHIQFGNQVSEKGGNKLRRSWKPNVQKKRMYSMALDDFFPIRITTHALRCIDKAGGFDEYLVNLPEKKVYSDNLKSLRQSIIDMRTVLKETDCELFSPKVERKLKLVMGLINEEDSKKKEEVAVQKEEEVEKEKKQTTGEAPKGGIETQYVSSKTVEKPEEFPQFGVAEEESREEIPDQENYSLGERAIKPKGDWGFKDWLQGAPKKTKDSSSGGLKKEGLDSAEDKGVKVGEDRQVLEETVILDASAESTEENAIDKDSKQIVSEDRTLPAEEESEKDASSTEESSEVWDFENWNSKKTKPPK